LVAKQVAPAAAAEAVYVEQSVEDLATRPIDLPTKPDNERF
jgi:hypothetical protein